MADLPNEVWVHHYNSDHPGYPFEGWWHCDEGAAGGERFVSSSVVEFMEQKPLRMLSDLYCRFAKAAREKDEVTMRRIDVMIEDFRWAWPDAARQHDELYSDESR